MDRAPTRQEFYAFLQRYAHLLAGPSGVYDHLRCVADLQGGSRSSHGGALRVPLHARARCLRLDVRTLCAHLAEVR